MYFGQGEPAVAIDVIKTQFDRGSCGDLINKATCAASDFRKALRQHSVLVVASDPSAKSQLTANIVTKGTKGRCAIDTRRAAEAAATRAAETAF